MKNEEEKGFIVVEHSPIQLRVNRASLGLAGSAVRVPKYFELVAVSNIGIGAHYQWAVKLSCSLHGSVAFGWHISRNQEGIELGKCLQPCLGSVLKMNLQSLATQV